MNEPIDAASRGGGEGVRFPLFVLGAGRSGTTVFYEALGCLDEVATVPRIAGVWDEFVQPAVLLRRLNLLPRSLGRPSAESTALFDQAGLTPDLRRGLGHSVQVADVPGKSLRKFAERLGRARRLSGAQTLAVKNTAACAMVPVLSTHFPASSFLHVYRAPERVVMSLLRVDFWPTMRLRWDGREAQVYAREEGLAPETVAARHWARQVGTALDDLDRLEPTRVRHVSFDNFSEQPTAVLREVVESMVPHALIDARALARLAVTEGGSRGDRPVPYAVRKAVEVECAGVWERLVPGAA